MRPLSSSLRKLLLKHNLEREKIRLSTKIRSNCWGLSLLLGYRCFVERWAYPFSMFKLSDVLSEWYMEVFWNVTLKQTLICPFMSKLFLFQLFLSSRDILDSFQYSTVDCLQLCKNSQCILSPQCPRNFISSFLSALPSLTYLVIIYLHLIKIWWCPKIFIVATHHSLRTRHTWADVAMLNNFNHMRCD